MHINYNKLEDYKNMLITAHGIKRACEDGRTIPPEDVSLRHLSEAYIEAIQDLEDVMKQASLFGEYSKQLNRQQETAVKESKARVDNLFKDIQNANAGNIIVRVGSLTKLYFQELWFILRRGKVAPLVPTGRTGEAWREASNNNLPALKGEK